MKIAYLGAGAWGFCLASLLASKGHQVRCWTIVPELAEALSSGKDHPQLAGHKLLPSMSIMTDLSRAIKGVDLVVESVTSSGLRSVCEQLLQCGPPRCPFVITSKGIEQNSGLILPEIVDEVLKNHAQIALISGPSFAVDVIKGLPTSVVCSGFDADVMHATAKIFTTEKFRVYPNSDIRGVAYGGSLKNIIAIACGVAEGLGLGYSARAALMTRGLHEISKLAVAAGCRPATLYGLSGLGDLCLTCGAMTSRNFRFGYLLAKGETAQSAQKEVVMVVEGAYTCVSALQLNKKYQVPMPISETIYQVLYEGFSLKEAVEKLMRREIKEEHL